MAVKGIPRSRYPQAAHTAHEASPHPPAASGPTWLPAAAVPPRRLALWDVSFVSSETGWGAAQSGTAGVLLPTSDGGATWVYAT